MRVSTALALALCAAWMLSAALALRAPQAATAPALERILLGPSNDALLGRDDLGRSIAARVAAGAGASLAIAATVVSLTAVIGIALGLLGAWLGGLADLLLVRLIDVFLAFPGILLAIALSGLLGPGPGNVVLALVAVGWVGFARLARALALGILGRDHVAVARALGTPPHAILWRHVLPLMRGPLVVEATFGAAAAIVAEAGLSFLGLGLQPPTPSWGGMIRDGMRYLLVAPHVVVAPGLALASLVVAINLLGDRLHDRWRTPAAPARLA